MAGCEWHSELVKSRSKSRIMSTKLGNEACDCGWVAVFGRHRANRCICRIVMSAASNPQPALAFLYTKLAAAAEAEAASIAKSKAIKSGEKAGGEDLMVAMPCVVTEKGLEEVLAKSNRAQCDCQWVHLAGKHRKNRCVYRIAVVAALYPLDAVAFLRKVKQKATANLSDGEAAEINSPTRDAPVSLEELMSALESVQETPAGDFSWGSNSEDEDNEDENDDDEDQFADASTGEAYVV